MIILKTSILEKSLFRKKYAKQENKKSHALLILGLETLKGNLKDVLQGKRQAKDSRNAKKWEWMLNL